MKNANKSPKNSLFCSGDGNGKVIRNPYLLGPITTVSFSEIG